MRRGEMKTILNNLTPERRNEFETIIQEHKKDYLKRVFLKSKIDMMRK